MRSFTSRRFVNEVKRMCRFVNGSKLINTAVRFIYRPSCYDYSTRFRCVIMGEEVSRPYDRLTPSEVITTKPPPSRVVRKPWNPFRDEDFLKKSKSDYRYYRTALTRHFKDMQASGTLKYALRDSNFPSNDSSLYYSQKPYHFFLNLEWKRPKEISSQPKLRIGGSTTEDVIQGELGDCWFLASLASVAKQAKFLNQILPVGQDELSPASSLGYYYVRFWKFGEWISVVINDRLPTRNGKLVFGRCVDENEYWVSLVEKAFACLYGTYEAIDGGFTVEAMEDLTGGLSIQYDLGKEVHPELFSRMMKAYKNNTFMTCTYRRTGEKHGLISLHAYTVTGAFRVRDSLGGKTVELVKIRNPYGDDEWTGDWSDSSPLWSGIDLFEKKRIGFKEKNNGEFWMSFKDFKDYFGNVKLCAIGGAYSDGRNWNDKWCLTQTKGRWITSIGSNRRDYILYAMNPQFYLQILHPDDFDPDYDDPDANGKSSITIGLMQEDKRHFRHKGLKNLFLSLDIYQVDQKPSIKLGPQYFHDRQQEKFSSGKYINKREVTLVTQLIPGNYILVPSRYYNDNGAKFLIRIFSEKTVYCEEL